MRFIDEHKTRFGGVDPICRVLSEHGHKVAPSMYYAFKVRPPSARAVRDEQLRKEIRWVFKGNDSVYGTHKIWRQLNREGITGARCTVRRLMRAEGIHGAVRGTKVRTTVADPSQERTSDLLNRDFTAEAPNRRWVADFTHVATQVGVVYVAFVIDVYSRAIVGWAAATNKRTSLVLNALQTALWRQDRAGQTVHDGPVHHSDAGSRYTSFRFTAHLMKTGIDASIGTVGDALDNALMKSAIGLYKTELIKPRRLWRTLAEVELATAQWVDWYNGQRIHTEIGDAPPNEHEAAYYAQLQPQTVAGANN